MTPAQYEDLKLERGRSKAFWKAFASLWKRIGADQINRAKQEPPESPPLAPIGIDPQGIARSCISKRAYPSEETARDVALKCWRQRSVSLRAYLCDACSRWHLTRVKAAPIMCDGWRPPAKSQRQLARERKARRRQR